MTQKEHNTKTMNCPNKELCGSCGWSHIPYEKQLQQKLADINGSFALKKLATRCTEIIGSPVTSHYRNRMDFVIDFEGRVGMRQEGKWWKVIDGHTCFIADMQIDTLFAQVRNWVQSCGLSYFDRKAHTGLLRYAVIRATRTGQTMITIITSAPTTAAEEQHLYSAFHQLHSATQPTTLVWAVNHTVTDVSFGDDIRVIAGEGAIEELVNDFRYRITPNAFFQTNSHAAPLLQNTVLEYAGEVSEKTVLDLYCGSGFFAIPFATSAKKTIGIEIIPEAIVDAGANAQLNGVNAEFFDAKTEEFHWQQFNADVVVLDPPRSGMHDKALHDILEAQPERIVYVSCNYKNFARELVLLQEHYAVEQMRAIDLFPHTPHVELVTSLVRK